MNNFNKLICCLFCKAFFIVVLLPQVSQKCCIDSQNICSLQSIYRLVKWLLDL